MTLNHDQSVSVWNLCVFCMTESNKNCSTAAVKRQLSQNEALLNASAPPYQEALVASAPSLKFRPIKNQSRENETEGEKLVISTHPSHTMLPPR